jgi:hypothetical protein
MEVYDKLTKVYPSEHFSLSNTQTVIEEDEKGAATHEVIIEHAGVDVLKISKSLLALERDSIANNPHAFVCDGVIAIDEKNKFIGYFELKSTCSTNNVLKARAQIIDSQHHLRSIASKSAIDMTSYTEKGIVVSQPISDEARRKARLRRQMYDERGNGFSPYHFLLNLLKGKAVADETASTS